MSTQLPSLTDATARANRWFNVARPIIKAMFALDDEAISHVRKAWVDTDSDQDRRTFDEARRYIEKAQGELFAMLDGIRDDFLCDECPPQPSDDADEQVWIDRDEWYDALRDAVITVDQAEKLVTDEHNRSFAL